MKPLDRIHKTWNHIKPLTNSESVLDLKQNVLPNIISYPKPLDIFRVFSMPLNKINVVILGQDPYHGLNQATGLSFSVNEETTIPPSLRIIKKEVLDNSSINEKWGENVLFMEEKEWKTLNHWETQGVFMLNTTLTVESGKPGSHIKYWESFTTNVIKNLSLKNPCIWLLWGKHAQKYLGCIQNSFIIRNYDEETIDMIPEYYDKNYVFLASHPASEAYRQNAGFLGCNHFKFANKVLEKIKNTYINW